MSIKNKIIVSVGLITLLGLVLAVVSLISVEKINDLTMELQVFGKNRVFFVSKIADHLKYIDTIHKNLLDKNTNSILLEFDFHKCSLGKFLYGKKVEALKKKSPELNQLFDSLIEPHKEIHKIAEEVAELIKDPLAREKAISKAEELQPVLKTTLGTLYNVNGKLEKEQKIIENRIDTIRKSADATILFSIIFFIVTDILIFIFIIRPLIISSSKIINRIRSLAEGQADLTRRIEIDRMDEYGIISEAINRFIERIQKLILEVKSNSQTVSAAALEISSSTEELSVTVEGQSEQANSVSTALNQLATTSSDIAVSMEETKSTTDESSQLTQEGSKIIENSIGSLKQIESQAENLSTIVGDLGKATDKIGTIVAVIRDVADQTNLLALNAAIEAARAGEHGRGFAVVADEVRKLAERTGKATSEIVDIIGSLQQKANDASKAMEQTSEEVVRGREFGQSSLEILEKIVESGTEVQRAAETVAAAIEEENATMDEVSGNLQEMVAGSMESATAVQDVSETADNLAKEAENLKSLVNQFVTE